MKTIAKFTSLALLVATLTVYVANHLETAVNAAPATPAQNQTAPNTDIEFGAVKIGKSQNASIIAILATDRTGRDQRPVDVEFIFKDWAGNVLASETRTLMPGQASSFEIQDGIRLPGKSIEFVASAKVLVDPYDPRANRVTATLQVSDETGKVQSLQCRKAGGDA
ncbi:MAG TPA: hypothetical protein VFF31_02745 [Blastocatellia bacterium]|nr:hypothetical protein [Blastocatellia bacterium]